MSRGVRRGLHRGLEHRRRGGGDARQVRVRPGQRAVGGVRPGRAGRDDGAEGARRHRLRRARRQPRPAGYQKPTDDDGVWDGGADLVAGIDPTITPEVQYVVLRDDQHRVVTSDTRAYAASAAKVATGDADALGPKARRRGRPGRRPGQRAAVDGRLRLRGPGDVQADQDDQDAGRPAGGRGGRRRPAERPADGDAAGPDARVVVAHFEDADQAKQNLRPRARLAVGAARAREGLLRRRLRLTALGPRAATSCSTAKPRRRPASCCPRSRRAGAVRDLLSAGGRRAPVVPPVDLPVGGLHAPDPAPASAGARSPCGPAHRAALSGGARSAAPGGPRAATPSGVGPGRWSTRRRSPGPSRPCSGRRRGRGGRRPRCTAASTGSLTSTSTRRSRLRCIRSAEPIQTVGVAAVRRT